MSEITTLLVPLPMADSQTRSYIELRGKELVRGLYEIVHVPQFIYNINYQDKVVAIEDETGNLVIHSVVKRGNYDTLRLYFNEHIRYMKYTPQFYVIERNLDDLRKLGCIIEKLDDCIYAVHAPLELNRRENIDKVVRQIVRNVWDAELVGASHHTNFFAESGKLFSVKHELGRKTVDYHNTSKAA